MSEKMQQIKSLAAEADNYSLEEEVAQMYVYNAEKSVWEAKEIINKINAQIKKYDYM